MDFIDPDDNFVDPDSFVDPDVAAPQRAAQPLQSNWMELPIAFPEVAAEIATGSLASVGAGFRGLGTLASGGGLDKAVQNIQETQEKYTYKPKLTDTSKHLSQQVGELLEVPVKATKYLGQKVGGDFGEMVGEIAGEFALDFIPVAGGAMAGKKMSRKPAQQEKPNFADIIAAEDQGITPVKPVANNPKGPVYEQAELLPSNAPQFGIDHSNADGMWTTGPDGHPFRADVSMDAQIQQDPLQRNLWGDDMVPAAGAERTFHQSMDTMADQGGLIPDAVNNLKEPVSSLDLNPFAPEHTLSAMDEALVRNDPNALNMDLPKNPTSGSGSPIPKSQLGGILNPFGEKEVPKLMAVKPPKPDTDRAPTSPERVEKKLTDRTKLEALRRVAPEHYRVTTVEEAKAIAEKESTPDIPPNYGRNQVASGTNAMVNFHPKNPFLNFTRSRLQEPRNQREAFSRLFITDPKNGIVSHYRKMKPAEYVDVAVILNEAQNQRKALTPELMDKMGLNENQRAFVDKLRMALDTFYELSNDANMSMGFEPFNYIKGYLPGMFSGGYRALVGHYEFQADGTKRFVVEAVPNADTRSGLKAALDHYKTQGDKFSVVIPMRRSELKGNINNRKQSMFDGFQSIIAEVARHDPEFAKTKMLADAKVQQKIKHLYGFDVHELNKKGVQGNLGNKPWVSKEQNAKELMEGIIEYLETGSQHYFYQKPLNEIASLTNDPEFLSKYPNTAKYMVQHMEHVTGQSINAFGAGANLIVDSMLRPFGMTYKVPAKAVHELKNIMSLHMMGVYNPAFFAAQLMQVVTGAGPEALKLKEALGDGTSLTRSFGLAPHWMQAATLDDWGVKRLGQSLPPHIRDAYKWAQNHGMSTFNELELANEALKNKHVLAVEKKLAWPMALGEKATRPTVFLAITDMLHQFGIKGEEGHLIAQNITNFAMGDYHFDERPHVYGSLGVLGHFAGALTTFKHNNVSQWWTRAHDAYKRTGDEKHIAPLLYALAGAAALQGVSGVPFYDELDDIVKKFTGGKSIREMTLGAASENASAVMDGLASWASGIDFQSRLSLASMVPDDATSLISPQFSALWNILVKAKAYAEFRDEHTKAELIRAMTPSGMKGLYEEAAQKDAEGNFINTRGQNVHPQPRTEEEWKTRSLGGFRPLRERLESDDVYSKGQQTAKDMEKLTDLSTRMTYAIALGDYEAYVRHGKAYVAAGGDAKTVFSKQKFEKAVVDAKKTERQRRAGTPNNLSTINRFNKHYD